MQNVQVDEHTGVLNPYALAELVAGRTIEWNTCKDRQGLLSEILETPYSELFDPENNSPLYPGLQVNSRNEVELVPENKITVRDLSFISDSHKKVFAIQKLNDLEIEEIIRNKRIGEIPVKHVELLLDGTLRVDLSLPGLVDRRMSNVNLEKTIYSFLSPVGISLSANQEWTPEGASWADKGQFIIESAIGRDPDQGAVANCYFIAALSSVAWVYPFTLSPIFEGFGLQSNVPIVHSITFYSKGGSKDSSTRGVEVSERLVVNASSSLVFAKSTQPGELWPGVYEKAFAKWITNNNTDKPDIKATAYGNCIKAAAQLIDGEMDSHKTVDNTLSEIFASIQGYCNANRKTRFPVVASTYGTSKESPDKVVYSCTNLVANHCYSILGWATKDSKKYIILRNPWGRTEASCGLLSGTWSPYIDSSGTPIPLDQNDGIFGLQVEVFKQYFKSWGAAIK